VATALLVAGPTLTF